MEDYFEDLYEDNNDEDVEPSFSLYEFKKWLAKQKKPNKPSESIRENKKNELKDKFKEKFKDKLRKKKKDD